MEISKKKFTVGIFVLLIVGVAMVAASGYYSVSDIHRDVMGKENYAKMHDAMMRGDFDKAEEYHSSSDFECPMHEVVENGEVSVEEFQAMHQWMGSGDFPDKKPGYISESAWEVHVSHHPEIYR